MFKEKENCGNLSTFHVVGDKGSRYTHDPVPPHGPIWEQKQTIT